MNELTSLEEIGAEKIGPETLSTSEILPGVFDNIVKGFPIPRLIPKFKLNSLIGLYGETGITWSKLFIKVLNGDISFREFLQEKLRTLIDRFRNIEVIDKRVELIHVIFDEIHCPKVNGCMAYHTQKTENSSDYHLELKILGYGGGSGKSVKIGTGYQIPAREECRYILKPAKTLVEICEYEGKKFRRVSILEIKEGFKTNVIPQNYDQCMISHEALRKRKKWTIHSFEPPYGSPPSKVEREINVGNQWNHSLGAKFSAFSIRLKISTTILKSTKYEYNLIGPKRYFGYFIPRTLGYYWTWENL